LVVDAAGGDRRSGVVRIDRRSGVTGLEQLTLAAAGLEQLALAAGGRRSPHRRRAGS
jgi:hypothetical protein